MARFRTLAAGLRPTALTICAIELHDHRLIPTPPSSGESLWGPNEGPVPKNRPLETKISTTQFNTHHILSSPIT